MIVKTTDKGFEFIEADCQYKDFEGDLPIDGKVSSIRFIYKKNVALRINRLFIGKNEIDWKQVHYSTLDYQYHMMGLVDLSVHNVEFKKGEKFIFKQFSDENKTLPDGTKVNWDRYRNMVEKIQLFFYSSKNVLRFCVSCDENMVQEITDVKYSNENSGTDLIVVEKILPEPIKNDCKKNPFGGNDNIYDCFYNPFYLKGIPMIIQMYSTDEVHCMVRNKLEVTIPTYGIKIEDFKFEMKKNTKIQVTVFKKSKN